MITKTEELKLQGRAICRGIAIGRPFFLITTDDEIPEFDLQPHEIEVEKNRYEMALTKSIQDVIRLRSQLLKENVLDGASILDAHLQIMRDPLLTTEILEGIARSGRNAESVFQKAIQGYHQKFCSLKDSFFRERFKDIQGISRRIMSHLLQSVRITLADIPPHSIVFARDLSASEIAEASQRSVCAIVTENGGASSHSAIVAKARGIPYVICQEFDKISLSQIYQEAIVDGRSGEIFLNPTFETVEKYQLIQAQLADHRAKLSENKALHVETYDGYSLRLSANIDMIGELDLLHLHGGSGVGLFRSEYIFLSGNEIPSEEVQVTIYADLVKKMGGLPIVIRTFDMAGDKLNDQVLCKNKENPFFGARTMRFMLRERSIFKQQLRAILRASVFGQVSIMFPMISGVSELLEAKGMVQEVKDELNREGIPFAPDLRIGCMIEIPSAAIIADLLAKECHFLSIGTNDLFQYSLAVDRSVNDLNCHYSPIDPSVIRLIKLVVTEANHRGIPVTVCGEIASDPRNTALFLGLGLHEISVTPRYLPIVKNAIRNTSIVAASYIAEMALTLSTAKEIEELLTEQYRKSVSEESFYNY